MEEYKRIKFLKKRFSEMAIDFSNVFIIIIFFKFIKEKYKIFTLNIFSWIILKNTVTANTNIDTNKICKVSDR